MQSKIENMRCEYRVEPLGIDVESPLLTWTYTANTVGTAEHCVIVALDEQFQTVVWDSGWQKKTDSQMHWLDTIRRSDTRIWWKAMTRMTGKPETQAEGISWFEMGLLHLEDFHGTWIRADSDFEAPVFRKEILMRDVPNRARMYICGLGFFEAYINGRKVGNAALQPVLHTYSRQALTNMLYPYDYQGAYRTPYCVFAVEDLLNAGKNTLEIRLGNGWYHQHERNVEGDLWYGDSPVLWMEMRADEEILCTDTTWQWTESETIRNNIFYGETIDKTRIVKPYRSVCMARAPEGKLTAQMCPSDAAMETYPVVCSYASKNGNQILDFGQNVSGWAEVSANAQRGDTLTLRFAEEITTKEGLCVMNFDSAGGDNQIQTDIFTFAGDGKEEMRPHFCWHGFRYVEASLMRNGRKIPLSYDRALVADGFRATILSRFVTTDHAVTGKFHCDNELLNWYHHAAVASLRSNEHCGVPLDCPQRERLGYTGDGQVTTEAILHNLDSNAFIAKWMQDLFDAQNRVTGHIPHTAPFYNGGGGPGGWGGAVVFVPWELYRHTGDVDILRRATQPIKQWMDYLRQHSENGIVVREEEGGWCLGEWCTPDKVVLPPEFVNTVMTIRMLSEIIEMAKILQDKAWMTSCVQEIEQRRQALIQEFYCVKNAEFCGNRQGANAMALWCGVSSEIREAIWNALLKHIEEIGYHFDTGIFGTPILLDVLSTMGRADIAYRLMTAEGTPSFAQIRALGATTLYESWNGGGSHNHAMFGAADTWLYAWAGGIAQEKSSAGWRNVVLRPNALSELRYADASIETPLGRLAMSWQRDGALLRVHTQIPTLCHAVMRLPNGESKLVPTGKHDWQFML